MSRANINSDPSAVAWHVYTSFGSDIDLTDGSQGPMGVPARAIQVLTNGTLVVVKPDGGTETVTGLVDGFQLVGQCATIKSSGGGTTVTALIAFW